MKEDKMVHQSVIIQILSSAPRPGQERPLPWAPHLEHPTLPSSGCASSLVKESVTVWVSPRGSFPQSCTECLGAEDCIPGLPGLYEGIL